MRSDWFVHLIDGNENKSHYPSRQLVACYAISIVVIVLNKVNIKNRGSSCQVPRVSASDCISPDIPEFFISTVKSSKKQLLR